ncbi:tyrosine-protein phosphatase [Rhodococcus sp. TAF43]|uniref:tyrosine-protein phosphatase n=1 Tax=unclassified Rhodococcus (in: high G+C Gram-positive bacteria) TaxID=192944 RepID=UPI000E0AE80C|nr:MULTISPECIES: tyrosine-protein phosphatase [unclassified Rhodococcus (in: high G+C Gram-positive bacteria)]QKT12592.1 tyrosine-protein phosphatase [Rhodococcus sp. W8901]RDI25700.1 protein-tyrosine phosphatase [Rhodococcus sp. AG1013]
MTSIPGAKPGASIPILSVPNLRDIGGYRTSDGGSVRFGRFYRSTDLSKITVDDAPRLADLGLVTVFDLRTHSEREAAPDRLPASAREVALDVLADKAYRSVPAQMQAVLADPSIAVTMLGENKAVDYFLGSYRDFVTLPSAIASYRGMFTDLAAPDALPALVHCTTGKDRTGWATASLLLLLGVDEDDVYHDYLLTNTQLLPAFASVFDKFTVAGGDPELLKQVLGVRSEYLDAALKQMRESFGTIEGYFADGLGIDKDGQETIRKHLVEG